MEIRYSSREKYEDYLSVAYIGAVKALKSYDEALDVKFITYCNKCVYNQILMELIKYNKNVKTVSLNAVIAEINNREFTVEGTLSYNIHDHVLDIMNIDIYIIGLLVK